MARFVRRRAAFTPPGAFPFFPLIALCPAALFLNGCAADDNNGIAAGYETLKPNALKSAAPMCPWRDPEGDLKTLFPGADSYKQETLILSAVRVEIQKRLGTGAGPETNALYVYRVSQGAMPRGVILVRRTSGEYGAIEAVVGRDADGKIVGVRIQRHREPPQIAAALTDAHWLGAFVGKTDANAFRVGGDLPAVPPAAQKSADALAQCIRALLIEYSVGRAYNESRKPL